MVSLSEHTSSNSRHSNRKSWCRKATIVVSEMERISAVTIDLSEGGFSVYSDHPIPENKICQLHVRFFLGESIRVLDVQAKLIYCWLSGTRGYRAGFQFLSLSDQELGLIKQIIGN